MGSNYRALCLSHDPAIVTGAEWHAADTALAALAGAAVPADDAQQEALAAHAGCDLVIGRYSYPLVEVCCPPQRAGSAHFHAQAVWADRVWLWLLDAARGTGSHKVDTAVKLIPRCWSADRLGRLRHELGDPP